MKRLTPPSLSGTEIWSACLSKAKTNRRTARLTADEPARLADYGDFELHLSADGIASHAPLDWTDDVKDDMIWVFEERLRRPGTPGRKVYELLVDGGGTRCPLCGYSAPSTLDHTLAKSTHPRLAVHPMNLVPACDRCNRMRGVVDQALAISPYADAWFVEDPWLGAQINDKDAPELLSYVLQPPAHWDQGQRRRALEHFEKLGLSRRFTREAIPEFKDLELAIHERGIEFYSEFTAAECEMRRDRSITIHGVNSWKAAAYAAWLEHVRN